MMDRTCAAPIEGRCTVTINGQVFEGIDIVEFAEHRELPPTEPRVYSGSFEGELTQSSRDRLLHWVDAAQLGRYWLRRRGYLRGKQRRIIESKVGRAWRRFRRNFAGGPA